ncbi:hypothetical protein VNO77_16073 [Canavalia gladiata]|uniref:Uncharacterized protein n=1 Tax=Canavalia gladiata TaxID=3824 RepID=A0AAN9QRP9_CANGL
MTVLTECLDGTISTIGSFSTPTCSKTNARTALLLPHSHIYYQHESIITIERDLGKILALFEASLEEFAVSAFTLSCRYRCPSTMPFLLVVEAPKTEWRCSNFFIVLPSHLSP